MLCVVMLIFDFYDITEVKGWSVDFLEGGAYSAVKKN